MLPTVNNMQITGVNKQSITFWLIFKNYAIECLGSHKIMQ